MLNDNPAGTAPGATETVTEPAVMAAPFRVSFVNTFGIAVPPAIPLIGVAVVSLFATIGAAATFTVTCAVSQFVGFSTSQMV